MDHTESASLSALEYHVLLALASGPLHGYAITDAIAADSGGALTPRPGSLYRVIARLITSGQVADAPAPRNAEPHPGLPRKYYAITARGRATMAAESRRLKTAVALAEKRLASARGRS
jgi:DNA-binding PadR family transcriptional regulator